MRPGATLVPVLRRSLSGLALTYQDTGRWTKWTNEQYHVQIHGVRIWALFAFPVVLPHQSQS